MGSKSERKSEILTPLQRERLDSIGFIWDVLEHQFEKGFSALESFKEREGHCLVPQHYKEAGVNLGTWVSGIRVRKDKLDAERLQRLENLGFIWDVLAYQFEQGFAALKSFQEREGHCMVPGRHEEKNYKLGAWIVRLRAKKDQIEPENVKRLDDIGFLWDPRAFKFEQGLAALKTFYEREGHCMVPGRHKENGYRLGAWVTKLRPKRDTLSIASLSYLNEIGFVWNVPEYQFEQGFSALKTFYEREGHCLVPQRYDESGVNLGSWVSERRANKAKLDVEKRKMLDSLGFVWDVRSSQFEAGFSALQAFYEREGHCRVPYNNHEENGINLSNWVKVRRKSKDNMKSEWRQRLDEIGFVWKLSE